MEFKKYKNHGYNKQYLQSRIPFEFLIMNLDFKIILHFIQILSFSFF